MITFIIVTTAVAASAAADVTCFSFVLLKISFLLKSNHEATNLKLFFKISLSKTRKGCICLKTL